MSEPTRITDPPYLAFPFRVREGSPEESGRGEHVRGQIEQVLFTDPGERVFRPGFGAGMRRLLFEPNARGLREVARKRLMASLAEALRGEVDPRTLEVEVEGTEERLEIEIRYKLAAVDSRERHLFRLTPGGSGDG